MSLKDEFRRVLVGHLEGKTGVEEIEDWLAGHFQALHDQPDRELDDTAKDVYILVHEYWNQALSLDQFDRELADLIAVAAPD